MEMKKEIRLIDANALLENLGEEPMVWSDGEAEIQERNDWQRFKACVEAQDTVDAEPVVHGHWVKYNFLGHEQWVCSECQTLASPQWKRCPVCETKMDGERKDNG